MHDLHAQPLMVGFVLAAEGVGGVLGAAVCARLRARWGTARAAVWGSIASAVLILLLPLAGGDAGLVLFAVGTLGFDAGGVVTSINTRTYRQVASPPELLSRVMATVRFVSWGVVPVGSVLAGALADTAGSPSPCSACSPGFPRGAADLPGTRPARAGRPDGVDA